MAHLQVTQLGKFLNAEFSWGRWNGDDARQLEEPLLMVVSRLSMSFIFPLVPDSHFFRWPPEFREVPWPQLIHTQVGRLWVHREGLAECWFDGYVPFTTDVST